MPEAPPAPPLGAIKPAVPTLQFNISGQSPLEAAHELGGKSDIYDEPQGSVPGSFGDGLKAAQARDKGVPAPEPSARSAAIPETPATPKIPGLPATQVDEWKPRGETAKHFDTLKAKHASELAEWKARHERLDAEYKAFKTNGSPDQETMKKERDQYREILRDVAIERDPEFKNQYATRTSSAIDTAKLAAGEKSEKLEQLLQAPPSQWRDDQINKIVEDLPPSSRRRVEAALTVLEQIDVERTSEIARRRQTFDLKQSEIMAHQKERDTVRAKEMNDSFSAVEKEWTERHPFFQAKDGDEKYNAEVKQSVELARHIYNGELSREELAGAAFWAASGERVLKSHMALLKELEQARSTIDKMRGIQPGEGKPGAPSEETGKGPEPGTPDHMRYFSRGLKEAQQADAQRVRGGR